MKTYSIIVLFIVGFLLNSTQSSAQEFLDQLAPVLLTKELHCDAVPFSDIHQELIEKETFSFRKEIKKAKKEAATVIFVQKGHTSFIPKSTYLKVLRKAGNKSEDVATFETFLTQYVQEFPSDEIDLLSLTKLYNVVRANTLEGSLDTLSEALTWL